MKLEQHRIGTVDVFTPIGPLVDEDGERFGKSLMERLEQPNVRIAIGMHEVPYFDSQAIERLLDVSDALAGRAMELKLAGITPTCREILELTNLSSKFRFFKDVQDAVKSFL